MKLFFTDGDKEQVTKIKVMADYGACTFDHEGSAFHLESIGIPSELTAKFSDWEDWYCSQLDDSFGFEVVQFDQRGLELARDLKRYVGNDVIVTYFSEATLEEVEIENVFT